MGSVSLFLLVVLFFFSLSTLFLYDSGSTGTRRQRGSYGAAESSEGYYWRELRAEKVSGQDNAGGRTGIPALEKLRRLLGLLRRPETGDADGIFMYNPLAPSPSPSPAPAPAPFPHPSAMQIQLPSPLPDLIPLVQDGQVSGSSHKAGRIIMAAMLSTGGAVVIIGLTGLLLLRRARRRRERRLEKMMQAPGATVGIEKPGDISGTVPSSRGMSSRPVHRLFFVNSLAKMKAQATSRKREDGIPRRNPLYSSSSNGDSVECGCELGAGNFPAKVAGCDGETSSSDGEDDGNCYHSVTNSRRSTPARSSDASERPVGVASAVRSPSWLPRRPLSRDSVLRASPMHVPKACQAPEDLERPTPRESRKEASPTTRLSPLEETSPGCSHSNSSVGGQCSQASFQTATESSNVPKPPPLPPLAQVPLTAPGFKFSRPPPPLPPLPKLLLRASPPPSQSPSCDATPKDTNASRPHPPPPSAPSPPSTRVRKDTGLVQFPRSPSLSKSSPLPRVEKQSSSCQPPPLPAVRPLRSTAAYASSPLPKLKPLHWDKVRAAPDQAMVWNKIRSSSFELDEKMMESLFSYNVQISLKSDEALGSSKNSYQFKLVLEPQRLRNFTILLKALNATPGQVCEALSRGTGLSAQQLEVLTKMVPTKEEELKLLSCCDEDGSELDPAEKFLASILRIPCSFLKIEVMLYVETFDDEVSQIRKSFEMLEAACEELRSSRLLLKLLEAVLRTGNRMNAGTMRGEARAFRLDALLKLADVKGTDGRTTLLHFILKEVIRSEHTGKTPSQTTEEDYRVAGLELVAALNGELCNVKKTAGFDFANLAVSISNLAGGMDKLKHLVSDCLPEEDRGGSFAQTMRVFWGKCERTIAGLRDDERRNLQKLRDTTEYFHGEVSKDEKEQLRIFVVVRDFVGMLEQTCKEGGGSAKKSLSPNCGARRILF